jgi:hypothetical protein
MLVLNWQGDVWLWQDISNFVPSYRGDLWLWQGNGHLAGDSQHRFVVTAE